MDTFYVNGDQIVVDDQDHRQLMQALLQVPGVEKYLESEEVKKSLENLKSRINALQNNQFQLVIVESPYAGDIESNTHYARMAVRDSLLRGEAPMASHLLYTQDGILDDGNPVEREYGIKAGLAWGIVASKTVVYIDLGISRGMKYGIQRAIEECRPVEFRSLPSFRGQLTVEECVNEYLSLKGTEE